MVAITHSAWFITPTIGFMAFLAACGGNVVVDHTGSGGSGGLYTVTTTGSITTTAVSTTNSTGTDVTTTTVTTGPNSCDSIGFCGDSSGGCIECALFGPCTDAVSSCQNSQDCLNYLQCIEMCDPNNTQCFDTCYMQFAAGGDLYQKLVFCVICDWCYISCDGANQGCP